MTKIVKFGAVVATALALSLSGASAADTKDQSILIDQAEQTVKHLRDDPAFGPAKNMLGEARAIMIIPNLVKGGFIFGAEGGRGVLLARAGDRWSAPAFYTMGSASFGFQAGLQKAEIAMIVMSDRALKAIQDGDVKLGAGGGLTVATLSAGAEAATASNLSGDLILWTSATGLYGGLTLNGSVIHADSEANEAFYGKPVSVDAIMAGQVSNRESDQLRADLSAVQKVAAK